MAATCTDIVRSLHHLGVGAGDLLLCHSSYKSFRDGVEGGPAAVARALLDAVGPGGTAFVPTFNYGTLAWSTRSTPSLTGAITEAFRRRPDAVRSDHPTHSIAGVGPRAHEFLRDHAKDAPFGPDSPIGRLWQADAWVLLLGVDHTTNSTIHVAEELRALPYLQRTRPAAILRNDGTTETITVRRPPCSNGFNVVDRPLRTRGDIREATAGGSRLLLMRARSLVHAALDLLDADRHALLCPSATCDFCDASRLM